MSIGVITGTTIKIISMKSIKKPAIKTVTSTYTKNISGVRFDEVIKSTITLSPSSPLNTREKDVAPNKIINTIEVNFVVSDEISFIFIIFRLPCKKLKKSAPAAPIPAASVGDAIPKNMDPSTAKIKIKGRKKH